MSVQENCILLGSRVVIPSTLQPQVLRLLHEGHPGISKMKAVARSHVWWSTLDEDITNTVRGCRVCQENQRTARPVAMTPWPYPEKPWSRIHIDFAGPLKNRYLLIVTDAFSKWIEVVPVTTPSADATIPCLRTMFAAHGLPDVIVSDNGPAFVSASFREFLQRNGIKHVLTPPYHPASNGAAERAVQTIKAKLKKAVGGSFDCQLARVLLNYRSTPHETTGCSPAELMMGRKLKTALTLLRPDMRSTVLTRQLKQKVAHEQHAHRTPLVQPGDSVYARNFRDGPPWFPAMVTATSGDHIADVTLPDGRSWRRHQEHLRHDFSATEVSPPAAAKHQVGTRDVSADDQQTSAMQSHLNAGSEDGSVQHEAPPRDNSALGVPVDPELPNLCYQLAKNSNFVHNLLTLLCSVDMEDELECLISGCNFLLKNITDEVFEYQRHGNPEYKFNNADPSVFPYLLVNIGSGVSIMKVESDDKYERIGGSATGGGTFWGLGSLMTKAKSFDELLELAEQGDHRTVDMLVKDIYGGNYEAVGLTSDLIACSFGKTVRHTGSSGGTGGKEEEDST
ncbi:hypothetical protein V5799_008352, partial [Amblyomma americanum]